MKSNATSKMPADFPRTQAEIDALIARAKPAAYDPEVDAYDPNDPTAVNEAMRDAVVVRSGGAQAVREALLARRTRGKGKKPAKELVSLRIPPDVLAKWKATGEGWQTRMVERLRF
ncbi:MAG: BrnA antitoxin family protein [Gallionellaceae bacterium]|jgi:uncharacterized protein (DUF4415 family)|nr:BrnA antitoxin family protein [Gallionellaceae bacterium]